MMSKRAMVGLVAVFLSLRMAGVAQEPGATAEDTDPIRFSVILRGEYTDNRDSTENNEESTFDFYFSPRVDAVFQGERSMFNAYYEPAFRYRTDPSDTQNDNEIYHDLGLDLDHDLTEQTKLNVRERFEFTDDPKVDEGGFTVREDESYILNRLDGSLNYSFSRLSYGQLSAGHMMKRYDEAEIADESDEDSVEAGLRYWQQVSPSVGLFGEARAVQYTFESSIGLDRDFDTYFVGGGLDKVFSPHLRGSARGGLQMIEYQDDSLDSQSEPYAQLDVRTQAAPSTRFTATLTHAVRDADVYPFSSQTFTDVRGRAEWDASANTTLGAHATYRLGEYDEDSLPAGAPPLGFETNGDETTVVLQADVAVKIARRGKLKLMQTLEDVDSDVEESYTENTSSVVVTMAF